jgi:hypothetical protein
LEQRLAQGVCHPAVRIPVGAGDRQNQDSLAVSILPHIPLKYS